MDLVGKRSKQEQKLGKDKLGVRKQEKHLAGMGEGTRDCGQIIIILSLAFGLGSGQCYGISRSFLLSIHFSYGCFCVSRASVLPLVLSTVLR